MSKAGPSSSASITSDILTSSDLTGMRLAISDSNCSTDFDGDSISLTSTSSPSANESGLVNTTFPHSSLPKTSSTRSVGNLIGWPNGDNILMKMIRSTTMRRRPIKVKPALSHLVYT